MTHNAHMLAYAAMMCGREMAARAATRNIWANTKRSRMRKPACRRSLPKTVEDSELHQIFMTESGSMVPDRLLRFGRPLPVPVSSELSPISPQARDDDTGHRNIQFLLEFQSEEATDPMWDWPAANQTSPTRTSLRIPEPVTGSPEWYGAADGRCWGRGRRRSGPGPRRSGATWS